MSGQLDWRGDAVFATTAKAIQNGLNKFGLKVETNAKRQVSPGKGKVTGTYQRSIHSANRNYTYARDNVPPSGSTPERGGRSSGATLTGNTVSIVIGSGMIYAMWLEKLYSPIRNGYQQTLPELDSIMVGEARKAGLFR